MSYQKIGWKNYPSTETPISATNLEHMDAGILENDQAIGDMEKIKEVGDGTLAGAVQVLNEGIGCAYGGISVIYRNNSDITEGSYTSTIDGFIQGIAKTAAKSGTPFVRLLINNETVFEGSAPTKNYSYLWSPLFEVRKGDIIKYTLKSDTDDSTKELRIYIHRPR